MNTAVAETVEKEVVDLDPSNMTIDPKSVTVDMEGFTSRIITVRLPEDWLSDHLRDPKIWAKVQKSTQHALRKYDRLNIYSFDESFKVEGEITMAGNDHCNLAILKITGFRDADQSLWSDGTLEIRWNGHGYTVIRSSDLVQVVPGSFANEKIAIGYALQWHGKNQV